MVTTSSIPRACCGLPSHRPKRREAITFVAILLARKAQFLVANHCTVLEHGGSRVEQLAEQLVAMALPLDVALRLLASSKWNEAY